MKKILIVFIMLILVLTYSHPVKAKKRVLPRFKHNKKTYNVSSRSYLNVAVSPILRRDKRALIVYFNYLKNAVSVSYTLSYKTNGKSEGARGTIKPSTGNSANRTLLFGTCSSGVCRYHTNITNMRFEVVSKLTSGKTSIKRYRVRL